MTRPISLFALTRLLALTLIPVLATAQAPAKAPAKANAVKAKPAAAKAKVPAVDPKTVDAIVETEMGSFRIEFAFDKAPLHVENFVKIASAGGYDGSAFHRLFAGGIIQGGDPLLKNPKTPRTAWGTGGLNQVADEPSDYKHVRGTVSAVQIPDKPNSGGQQFFVCIVPQPVLDGKYSAFGRVVEGIEVVDKISQAPADANQLALKPVKITKVRLEPKPQQPFLTSSVEELRRTVVLKTTLGEIKVKMEPDWAPEHVRNFLMLAQTGWYNGTAFHRVVPGYVVQGGMVNSRQSSASHPADRWVRALKAEFRPDVKHVKGVLSMARTSDPDSAMTSFFLMLGEAQNLDGKYSAFGRVVEGLEILEAFEKEPVNGENPQRRLELIETRVE